MMQHQRRNNILQHVLAERRCYLTSGRLHLSYDTDQRTQQQFTGMLQIPILKLTSNEAGTFSHPNRIWRTIFSLLLPRESTMIALEPVAMYTEGTDITHTHTHTHTKKFDLEWGGKTYRCCRVGRRLGESTVSRT
jgi:hypothetical protein